MRIFTILLCSLVASSAFATDSEYRRAQFNYQMFCQGCHAPDGSGAGDIPRLKDHVGNFLEIQAGREYLVRVPGSATSALSNADLAEVLNWIVQEFSGDSASDDFEPYSQAEVGRLRQHPLNEVEQYRADLLAKLPMAIQESK